MCKEDHAKIKTALGESMANMHGIGAAVGPGPGMTFGMDIAPEMTKYGLGGRAALRNRARQLREEAESLEHLARSIPEEITPKADEALIRLAYGGR
jgi:hypothetical protein